MSSYLGQTKQILGHPNTVKNGSKYIMIVDDQPDILDLLQGYLESKGLKIKTFIGPGIALLSLMTNPKLYSLIITDIRMPEMDGIQATRIIKTKIAQLPVIVLTLYSEYREAALAAGANAFLLKGEPVEQLMAVLLAACSTN